MSSQWGSVVPGGGSLGGRLCVVAMVGSPVLRPSTPEKLRPDSRFKGSVYTNLGVCKGEVYLQHR